MASNRLLKSIIPPLALASSITDAIYDGILLVTHNAKELANYKILQPLFDPIADYLKMNESAKTSAGVSLIPMSNVPSGRLVLACTGPVNRDYDDVRRFSTAARDGMKFALKAGIKSPLIITTPHKDYEHVELVSLLGALHSIYIPLIIRNEDDNEKRLTKANNVGVLAIDTDGPNLLRLATAINAACNVATDIGDGDPIRMAPPKVAEYIEQIFANTNVHVSVESDQKVIEKEYPLMAAVNRSANCVPEHQARLILLEYIPDGVIEETLMLVGKGVTIDTGGTDVKTGGHMLGMSRDKCGSAVVAGFFKALELLKPKNVKVIGYMCMVRNSIGSHSYTCDEIIKARSGKRIHVYNTDAEGRMAMLDPLTQLRDRAQHEVNPHLMTIATLTGHAALSMGYYATLMDNGPALRARSCYSVQDTAQQYGQPVEVSILRHEDFAFHMPESEDSDLRQGANLPSVVTVRGHQSPAAFLTMGSRLDEHGNNSTTPIKYTHIDMGMAFGDYPAQSTPNPLVALVAHYVLPRVV